MSTEIQLTHVYSPDQYTRVVAAWHRLLDNPLTSVDVHNIWTADKVAAEHLYALIVTDGEGTRDDCPIILTLASYSDYGGSCLDASNVRDLDGTPGVQVSTGGAHGSGSAWGPTRGTAQQRRRHRHRHRVARIVGEHDGRPDRLPADLR